MSTTGRAGPAAVAGQLSLADLDEPVDRVPFVVIDLETTGGSATDDAITEIGAVKVRGGRIIAEFATLVDPGRPVPPRISALTGITDTMLRTAPTLPGVLSALLEFCQGCVLVAHHAPFDMGFLRQACRREQRPWSPRAVIDTVRLARAVLDREEAPSVRLSALGPLLGARTRSNHRALADARATVDVLHALIARLGADVADLSDLVAAQRRVHPARRRQRRLAVDLPHAPGVYLFRGDGDEVLYVGKASDLRARVGSYFTAAERRRPMDTMVPLARRIDHVVCSSPLEAAIREQRLLAAHRPRYNRVAKDPDRVYWVRPSGRPRPAWVADTRWTRGGYDDGPVVGPFTSRTRARAAVAALSRALAATAADPQHLVDGTDDTAIRYLMDELTGLARQGRYAAAAELRDITAALVRGLVDGQRYRPVCRLAEVVAAEPDGDGGWRVVVIRHGRLAAAGAAPRGVPPLPMVDGLIASAATAVPGPDPLAGAGYGEVRLLTAWLERPTTRLVRCSGPWTTPATSAQRWGPFLDRVSAAHSAAPTRARRR